MAFDDVLRGLTLPAKILWGKRDAIIPIRHAAALPPMLALHTLPCGHMPHLEEPRLVAALIMQAVRANL